MPARTRLHGRGVAVIPPRACYVTFAGDPRGSDDFDLEDVAAVRTIQSRPSRMDTGITTDQSFGVPRQAVRITRAGHKIYGRHEFAGLAVILVQAGFALGVRRAVISGHDPNIAGLVERHVMKARLLRGVHANQDLRRPGRWVDAQNAAQTQSRHPQLAVVPLHTMATTTIAVDTERNLAVADLLRAEVDLKDAKRVIVGRHPHATTPVRDAGRISRSRRDRLEQFAVPIDKPSRFVAVGIYREVIDPTDLRSDLLLSDPQASGRIGHDGKR